MHKAGKALLSCTISEASCLPNIFCAALLTFQASNLFQAYEEVFQVSEGKGALLTCLAVVGIVFHHALHRGCLWHATLDNMPVWR